MVDAWISFHGNLKFLNFYTTSIEQSLKDKLFYMQVHLPAEPSCYPQPSFTVVAAVASSCKGDGLVPLSKVLASYFQALNFLNVFHHVSSLGVSAPPL